MSVEVTPRATEVLRRGLEIARLDPSAYGVRVRQTSRGTQTEFADAPEAGDEVVEAGGIRIFVAREIAARGATLDVTGEHDQIVVR